jgi:tetratricopeptide (TPR) repeat protein
MDVTEMQSVPEEPMTYLEETIGNITRQWKDGITPEVSYHSQMALLYGIMKNADECRLHAALIPDTASINDKVNKYISLARILVYEKHVEEAIGYYQKCLDIDTEHEMILEEIAWCCYHIKQYTEAEKWFRQLTILEPEWGNVWEGLALTLAEQKNYIEAIVYFTKALELVTNAINVDYYEYMIGLCYGNNDDFYRALSHYTKSLDANPRYAPSLTNIAALYFNHEADIKIAISYLQKAEVIAEGDEDNQLLQLVYINLGRLYSMIADYDLKDRYNSKLLTLLGFNSNMDEDGDS